MAISEELVSGFQSVNIILNQRVLEKCKELCITYNIDPEDFVDQWLAYTASNLNGEPPSLDTLDRMERKELQKQNKNAPARTPKTHSSEVCTTPVRNNTQKQPEQSPAVSQLNEPVAQDTPSQQFIQRSDARSIQCEFGNCHSDSFKERRTSNSLIVVQNEGIVNSKYMYEKFLLRQQSLNSIARSIVSKIVEHSQLELTQERLKDYSGEMVICGRVYSETSGRLNVQSVLLEGILDMYKGYTVKLVMDNLDKLALFSGQVVVVRGNNMKNRFMVKEIYAGAPLVAPAKFINLQETLQIVVAAGPFTLPDNLLYEPLEDLLNYVAEWKPNILILMGPFIEDTHPLLQTTNETYDSFFESITEGIIERLKGSGVQIIMVPSHKDVHNHIIFPSLPYKVRKHHENLIVAPNPSILDIEGLLIGACSADILFHISTTEIAKDNSRGPSDRMARLASYIFNQRSFYPLHPPDLDIRIDYQLLEKYGMMEVAPHLMFLPSKLRHFVKKVDDCIVVNPEKLAKGQVAGTFARIEVRPGETPIYDRISCQILRV